MTKKDDDPKNYLRQQILLEMGPRPWKHLNNFLLRFPLPPEETDRLNFFRNLYPSMGAMNKPHKQILMEQLGRTDANSSERYLNETPQQFFDTIDATIQACGIPLDEIVQKQRQILHAPSSEDYDIFKKLLSQRVVPVYIELRLMEYNDHDLTA